MIDRDKVYAYFDKYHGPILPSSNGWYSCKCPHCGKDKFAVNFTYLIGKCWRGCYPTTRFLIDIVQMYHGLINSFETREFIDTMEPGLLRVPASVKRMDRDAVISLPVGYHPILSGDNVLADRARRYLEDRGFNLNYLDRIGVGYCDEEHEDRIQNYFGRIIIPFKKNGILSYFIGRDYLDRGEKERYKNPSSSVSGVGKSEVFFNEEALYMQHKVYITEGWACAATIQEKGISQQGSTPSVVQKNIIYKSPVSEIVIIPDAGYFMKGLEAAKDIMRFKKTKVLDLSYLHEQGFGKDVNEIGRNHILLLEENTDYLDTKKLFRLLQANKHA